MKINIPSLNFTQFYITASFLYFFLFVFMDYYFFHNVSNDILFDYSILCLLSATCLVSGFKAYDITLAGRRFKPLFVYQSRVSDTKSSRKVIYNFIFILLIFLVTSIVLFGEFSYGKSVPLIISIELIVVFFLIGSVISDLLNFGKLLYPTLLLIFGLSMSIYIGHKMTLLLVMVPFFFRSYERGVKHMSYLFLPTGIALFLVFFLMYISLRDTGTFFSFPVFSNDLVGEFLNIQSKMGIPVMEDLSNDIYRYDFALSNDIANLAPNFIFGGASDTSPVHYAKHFFGADYRDGLGVGFNPFVHLYYILGWFSLLFLVGFGWLFKLFVTISFSFLNLDERLYYYCINSFMAISVILMFRGTIFDSIKILIILVSAVFLFRVLQTLGSLINQVVKEKRFPN